MRVSALICGLLGGVISLFVGIFGSALFSLAGAGGWASAGVYQFASFALPLLAIVGSGLALRNGLWAAGLLGASALGTVLLFGFGGFSILPVALIGVAAVLAFLAENAPAQGAQSRN